MYVILWINIIINNSIYIYDGKSIFHVYKYKSTPGLKKKQAYTIFIGHYLIYCRVLKW